MPHRTTIESFYAAWAQGDINGALAHCTDDVVAVNVPIGSVNGKHNLRQFLKKFGGGMSEARYDLKRVMEQGDTVMLEGQENYVKGGRRIKLPYMAVFFFENGLIREYRDYFDYATLKRQLKVPEDP